MRDFRILTTRLASPILALCVGPNGAPIPLAGSTSRLSFAFAKNLSHSGRKGPDKYFDEHGQILRVRALGSKHWICRGTVRSHRRDLGLGTFPYVSLSEAREKAFKYSRLAKRSARICRLYARRRERRR